MSDTNKEADPLFAEFDAPTYEEWVAATEASLKGKPFADLVTETVEGITLQPLYREADTAHLPHLHALPGAFPYVRGTTPTGYLTRPWLIAQELAYGTPQQFNATLQGDLAQGQTAVNLIPDRPTRSGLDPDQAATGSVGHHGVSLAALADFTTAFQGVNLAQTPLFIRSGTAVFPLAALLAAHARQTGTETTALQGSLEADPLGELARRGTLPLPLAKTYREIAQVVAWTGVHSPALQVITVHGYPYANAGGSTVQELAFALATAVAYLRALQGLGLDINTCGRTIQFAFSIGSDFFMEIARLRAARLLWAKIMQAFGGDDEAQKMTLHGRSARWNKSLNDITVNLLRGTTEALAAAIGGVDSLHVAPFDEEAAPPDAFSRRIARNTQIILQEEANLTRLVDPAGGAYFVESLTDQVAARAWTLFQEVEKRGGMAAALQAGWPQAQVAETAAARAHHLAHRQDVRVGTNLYANQNEAPPSTDDTNYDAIFQERAAFIRDLRTTNHDLPTAPSLEDAIVAAQAGATLGQITSALRAGYAEDDRPVVTPAAWHRGAIPFEQLRARAAAYQEQHGQRPQIFLANLGSLRQYKARADFTRRFFEIGGFDIIYPEGFATPAAAAAAAIDSSAGAVVICAPDAAYPEAVPPLVQALRAAQPDMVVILAGYPTDQVEAYKAAGIDAFIHVSANCLVVNQWLQNRLAVSRQL